MNKSILVIDTPKNCYCPLCFYTEMYSEYQCSGTGYTNNYSRTITEYGEMAARPEWCPLSPIPQRVTIPEVSRGNSKSLTHTVQIMYGIGYNQCIDDILKGETK